MLCKTFCLNGWPIHFWFLSGTGFQTEWLKCQTQQMYTVQYFTYLDFNNLTLSISILDVKTKLG